MARDQQAEYVVGAECLIQGCQVMNEWGERKYSNVRDDGVREKYTVRTVKMSAMMNIY